MSDEKLSKSIFNSVNKGGRPAQPKVAKPHEIQEMVNKVLEGLDQPDEHLEYSVDIAIDNCIKIICLIQKLVLQDAKTISPKHTIIDSTPNGRVRSTPVGLPKDVRDYLRGLMSDSISNLKVLKTLDLDDKQKESIGDIEKIIPLITRGLEIVEPPLEESKSI